MGILSGQVAVITGCTSGVGKAIAQALSNEGLTICLVGRNLETLKTIAKSISRGGSQVFSYQADLLLDTDIQHLIEMLQSEHEKINLLIHSAGVISPGNIETATIEDFDWQHQVNVRAPYLITQKLLPSIRACQGQIVFINSSVCLNARAGVGQYTATKQALKAIADCLRAEVNIYGIRVLSVYLGRTSSPMQEKIHKIEGKSYKPEQLIQPEDVAETVVHILNSSSTTEITDISIRPLKKPAN